MTGARPGSLRLAFCHDGTGTYSQLFLRSFASKYRTYLVTFARPKEIPDGIYLVPLRDFGSPLPIRTLNKLRIAVGTVWRIVQMCFCFRRLQPDIVVGNYATTYGLYVAACKFRPFVLFTYGSDVLIDPKRSLLHRWITRRVIQSADLIQVDSEVVRRAAISLGGSPAKIVTFPRFDLNDLRNVEHDSSFRRALGWNDKTVVVSVRLHEKLYDLDTLIRAIPIVVSRRCDIRFLVFGGGAQTAKLVKLASELNVRAFIHFMGFVPRHKMMQCLGSCDIYVSTSPSDGTSSSLLEAISLEIPVVATRIPGNAEWISDRVDGLLFESHDHSSLAEAILHLTARRAEASRLARRAKQRLMQSVNWDFAFKELVRRTDNVYVKHHCLSDMSISNISDQARVS
jgi:glycosyltransferase involved in cell wall biosynthesis